MSGPLESTLELEATAPTAPADTYAMPATQGQVRFWSLDQLNPGNPALNMPLMWQCTGPLDIQALRRTFVECLRRHESLRTTFAMVKGRLSQIIHPQMPIPIPVDDLTALTGESQRLAADQMTRAHAAFRFNLGTDTPLQLRLLKRGEQNHTLLVTMHHIICDGISNGILMRDMMDTYQAILYNTEAQLPELPIQFADYAVWTDDWRQSEDHERSLQFWRDTLGKDFNPIRLPHDSDAIAALPAHKASSTGEIETLLVPHDLTARAHAFCKREGVTLNVLMFSIFCTLLARLTGQRDLTIGSPCANRTEDTEELIGLFMNIQVLRVKLQADATFGSLLQQVQQWTLAAVENQAMPFEDIVHDPFFAEAEGSLEIPIFFLYQKSFMLTRRIESAAGSLQIVPLRSESPGAVFDVMFAVVDREEEGPRLQLEYNPQFYKASTIQGHLRLFINLLDSAITTPNASIDTLQLLSTRTRDLVLNAWNQTVTNFGPFESVATTFLKRAAVHPGKVAVECNGTSWTNRELATRAGHIAAHLRNEGLQPGDLVAICVSRSPEMLASVLAVMMSGAAYVPLDPRHPRERMEIILADSNATLLLTDSDLQLTSQARTLRIDKLAPTSLTTQPQGSSSPNDLAYVIYTSGSTGKPKGVAIEHRALINLLRSMEREPGLNSADTLVAVTTLAFDIATLELLLPLITGAKLIVATDDQVQNPAQLLTLIKKSEATVLQATPGAWRALIDAGWNSSTPLRVLCGGEAMSRDLADKLTARSTSVWNMYGPTETTIWSSATRVTAGEAPIRLGTPIANTHFYVLDQHLQPVPFGIEGELYIGGEGLARGYWNRPDLTASKFIPNPFAPGRLYQTGDLARRHEDGAIQILGRTDFQVKIRGYRVELGEIEAALTHHPLVKEAVVVHQQRNGTTVARLAAYVEAAGHTPAQTLVAELEQSLARTLPEYAIPNAIVVLDRLPRNTNGKLDRAALPDAFASAGDTGLQLTGDAVKSFLAPRDIIERQLAEMWQTTLGIPRISIRASFFSLGVSSLAALRLITRMNRIYSMDLGLASLISSSSIESIAELVRNRINAKSTSCLVPLKTDGDELPLFIIHGVGGNVISFYGLAMRIDVCQPVYGIQSQALLADQPALLRIEDMAAQYIREIRTIQPHGPYRLLGYSFGGTVALEMAHQLRAAGELVAPLAMLDSRTRGCERECLNRLSRQEQIDRRVTRFRGNTTDLSWSDRLAYFAEKAHTRSIRYAGTLAPKLGIQKLPSFMKSAWDINVAAINRYELKPFDGKLILFRATEQEFPNGPAELGWSGIFKQGVEIHEIAGDHERIFLEPSIDTLAAAIHTAIQATKSE